MEKSEQNSQKSNTMSLGMRGFASQNIEIQQFDGGQRKQKDLSKGGKKKNLSTFSKSKSNNNSRNIMMKSIEDVEEMFIDDNDEIEVNLKNDKSFNQIMCDNMTFRLKYEENILSILDKKNHEKVDLPKNYQEFSLLYAKKDYNLKRTLFIDIEDTLLNTQIKHSSLEKYDDIINLDNSQKEDDLYLNCNPKKCIQLAVTFRPYLYDFISEMSKHFELILFNDNINQYTIQLKDSILNYLKTYDTNGLIKDSIFSQVLSKEQSCVNESQQLIKNITFFTEKGSNRELENSLIIDNNVFCFQKNICNGIFIPSFNGNKKDNYLILLKNYLLDRIADNTKDIREIIQEDFQIQDIFLQSKTAKIKMRMSREETL